MNANQYRETIAKLCLTQVEAAQLLGVDERTSRKWALGENQNGVVPTLVAIVLRGLLSRKFDVEDVERWKRR